ncbi:WD40 repeat domain-containing protein [Candidatus Frankia alpina]|uniref:WD40 repeat domain-containing protein n=1 Tax=Candidatus Frankia alpina TaxID=2699483 RepID=UPI002E276C03
MKSVAFSRDSTLLATGSGDRTAKIWDILAIVGGSCCLPACLGCHAPGGGKRIHTMSTQARFRPELRPQGPPRPWSAEGQASASVDALSLSARRGDGPRLLEVCQTRSGAPVPAATGTARTSSAGAVGAGAISYPDALLAAVDRADSTLGNPRTPVTR